MEKGTFTPLLFSTSGGMGLEAQAGKETCTEDGGGNGAEIFGCCNFYQKAYQNTVIRTEEQECEVLIRFQWKNSILT